MTTPSRALIVEDLHDCRPAASFEHNQQRDGFAGLNGLK